MALENAIPVANRAFLGITGSRASNGRPDGPAAPAILDWLCRCCPELAELLRTDPLVQMHAAGRCMLFGNLSAAQWLLDVAGAPPSIFRAENMFSITLRGARAAGPRAILRWIAKVNPATPSAAAAAAAPTHVDAALLAALEAGAAPVSVRKLLRMGGGGSAVAATPRLGRAAIVASSLPALQRVFRVQKAAGACPAWRAPPLLARLAGRYARPSMLRWLYGDAATERTFGVQWRPEALVVAAQNERVTAVRWMLRAKYSLRSKRDPAQLLAARKLCTMLRKTKLSDGGCRALLRRWMCRFFGWTEAQAEERVVLG